MSFWLDEIGLGHRIEFAPYHQVFQTLLDGRGILAANRGGVNVILIRLEDWFEEQGRPAAEFVSILKDAAQGAEWLIVLCPPSPDWLSDEGHAAWQAGQEKTLAEGLGGIAGVRFATAGSILASYPVETVHDSAAEALGRLPYSQAFFAAVGTWVARRIHALRTPPFKVLALDCDNTLWTGICGEEGPAGVSVEAGNRELQEFALAQRAAGMLLVLCSRNNDYDVVETFQAHPEMPLKLEHFAARRVNWEAKSANLASIASDLSLGLDSFVFIDDDERECAEVAADCPGTVSIPFSGDGRVGELLRHVWAFDRDRITEADRSRAEQYAKQAERKQAERRAGSLAEFIEGLKLEISIEPATAQQAPRLAQLTQRTNQMNCGAPRRTEAELRAGIDSGDLVCLAVHVADRFGDYGLVGALLYRADRETITADTFLLSCRALGRGVEHAMLARLGEEAARIGLRTVTIPFRQWPRNEPARAFLDSIPEAEREDVEDGTDYVVPAGVASRLRWSPSAAPTTPAAAGDETGPAMRRFSGYARIASQLRTVEQILAAMRERRRSRPGRTVDGPLPRTATEARIAGLWTELLGVEPVGAEENFFDLGGHSLLAIQLLSRIRQEFGADLTLDVVYAGEMTVAEMARLVEMDSMEGLTPEEYEALVREIEAMPDEEVRALLEAESGSLPEA